MTILFALLSVGGGSFTADEGTYWEPYIIGGGILLLLLALVAGVMAFGKGREHS